MGTNNVLMRIFWPSDAPTGPSSGVLVGFRNSELDVFVVSVLQEVEVRTDRTMEDTWLTWHSFVKSIMRW